MHHGADCRCASAPDSGRRRGTDCGFHCPVNQGGAGGGLCLRSASTGTSWSRPWPSVASAVFQLFPNERFSERIELEHAKKCRRKRQKGKPGRDSGEELLQAAMTRAREEDDYFPRAVPQDESMKVRQAEVWRGVFRGFSPIPSRETRGERGAVQNPSKNIFRVKLDGRPLLRSIKNQFLFFLADQSARSGPS